MQLALRQQPAAAGSQLPAPRCAAPGQRGLQSPATASWHLHMHYCSQHLPPTPGHIVGLTDTELQSEFAKDQACLDIVAYKAQVQALLERT